MRLLIIAALLLSAEMLCRAEDQTAAQKRAKDEVDIAEVVFLQMFKHDGFGDTNKVYYLSVSGKEPTDEMIQRFAGHTPPVAKAKGYAGQKFWFSVGKIEWVDQDTMKVNCQRILGSPAHGNGRFVFRVVRKDGKWTFEKIESGVVS